MAVYHENMIWMKTSHALPGDSVGCVPSLCCTPLDRMMARPVCVFSWAAGLPGRLFMLAGMVRCERHVCPRFHRASLDRSMLTIGSSQLYLIRKAVKRGNHRCDNESVDSTWREVGFRFLLNSSKCSRSGFDSGYPPVLCCRGRVEQSKKSCQPS
jgi:hypothetical protein